METLIFNRPAGVAEALLEKVPRDVKILILSRLSIPDLLRYKFVNARAFYEAQMILAKKQRKFTDVRTRTFGVLSMGSKSAEKRNFLKVTSKDVCISNANISKVYHTALRNGWTNVFTMLKM